MHLVLGQTDAVVFKHQGLCSAGRLHDFEGNLGLKGLVDPAARDDCVHAVLKQLADKCVGRAVQVVRQQVDDAAQVDLEVVFRHARSGRSGV